MSIYHLYEKIYGKIFNMGVIGVYLALKIDECSRGLIMFIRWRMGKWEQKALVKNTDNECLVQ